MTVVSPSSSRIAVRTALAGCLVLAVLGADASDASRERPISVQLHVHGSFSEGIGSIDSHCWEASELGVDVLWWSDHDFRITGYERVSRFGFDRWREDLSEGEPWAFGRPDGREKWLVPVDPSPDASSEFVKQPESREGLRSLRLERTHAGDEFALHAVLLESDRWVHRTPLASRPVLSLSAFPNRIGPDARGVVEVVLSEHAPQEGLGLEQYVLRYHLVPERFEPWRDGVVFHVPVVCTAEEWNDLELRLVADVKRGFPFLVPTDNLLYALSFGVEARRGATASVCYDDLVIRTAVPAKRMFRRQEQLLAEVGERYPDVIQLQGTEISYLTTHMNEFSVGTELIDYAEVLNDPGGEAGRTDQSNRLAGIFNRLAVERAHNRGGLISLNHPFGVSHDGAESAKDREAVLADLIENEVKGTDLLEVGYRDRGGFLLADHLWLWDALARADLRVVGTGVSDSHGGEVWRTSSNNFVSWIWAARPEKDALIEAMRRGRVFFGDIRKFDGALELTTDRGWRMGDEVFCDGDAVTLEVALDGVPDGATLVFVRNGEPVHRAPVDAGASTTRHVVALTGETDVLRVELHDEDEPFLFSNPIHALQRQSSVGARPERTRIDVGGVRATRVEGVRLRSVRADDEGVHIEGDWNGGVLELELGGAGTDGPRDGIRWAGFTVDATRTDTGWVLRCEMGSGTITLLY